MNVLFLIEGWISPAPRYRVLQYLPYLVEQGITFKVRALHGNRYPFFYNWPGVGPAYKALIRTARRLYHIRDAHRFDVVFQQRLSLPFTAFAEKRLAQRNPKLIFDYDDALFQTEAGPDTTRARVFEEITRLAHSVVAGSDYLAGFSEQPAAVIPTVIDTDQYLPAGEKKRDDLVIGWMGTHSNYPNFEPLLPTLEALLRDTTGVRLHLVSDVAPPFTLPNTHFTRWHKDREIEHLQSFDVGIMPLADTDWNRGKCAFKLIQYMSVGIPVVAGNVGANREVVLNQQSGFLAESPEDWADALKRLIADADLRDRMGTLGRDRCVDHYSLRAAREKFVAILRDVAAEDGP